MLTMGIPEGAVRQALQKEGKDPDVATMDPNKSYASQAKPKVEDGPPLKDDPEYVKFFKVTVRSPRLAWPCVSTHKHIIL